MKAHILSMVPLDFLSFGGKRSARLVRTEGSALLLLQVPWAALKSSFSSRIALST